MLTDADVCYADATSSESAAAPGAAPYADVCGRILTHADVCGRMQTYAMRMQRVASAQHRMLTYADACGRMRTYADVCYAVAASGERAAALGAAPAEYADTHALVAFIQRSLGCVGGVQPLASQPLSSAAPPQCDAARLSRARTQVCGRMRTYADVS
jgi:hypothetical protein